MLYLNPSMPPGIITRLEQEQPPIGGIFLPENQGVDMSSFSAEFYEYYKRLLSSEGSGCMLQVGINEKGEVKNMFNIRDILDEVMNEHITIVFDARQRLAGRYIWQMTSVDKNSHEIISLHVYGQSGLEATKTLLNKQGQVTDRQMVDPKPICRSLQEVIYNPYFVEQASSRRRAVGITPYEVRKESYRQLPLFWLEPDFKR